MTMKEEEKSELSGQRSLEGTNFVIAERSKKSRRDKLCDRGVDD